MNPVNSHRMSKPLCSMTIKPGSGSGIVSFPSSYHAVVEHNATGSCSPLMGTSPATKRARFMDISQDLNECSICARVQGNEQALLMLSVLWNIKEGQGLLPEMFRTVAMRMGDHPCEFTLTRMEEKVLAGELTNVKDLMKSIRCLVLLHTILQNVGKVPKDVRDLLISLEDTRGCTGE